MRTTLDVPDPLFRELKTRAARSGQSLKALINELILRGLRSPAPADAASDLSPAPPVLARLNKLAQGAPLPAVMPTTEFELDEDLDKLRRSGFLP